MANRRFEAYEYRQVLVRMRQGQSDRAISRARLMGRDKAQQVRVIALAHGWLDSERILPDDAELAEVLARAPAPSTPSSLEPYRDQVAAWHREGIQGTTIYRLLCRGCGFAGSYSAVRRFARKLDPGPVGRTIRLHFEPGEAAQVDFGSGSKLADPVTGELSTTWFFVMTLCWSRHQYAEIVWDQKVPIWLGCHQRAFRFFGGVPRKVMPDNPKCAITRACFREPEVQRSYAEFAERLRFSVGPVPAARSPEERQGGGGSQIRQTSLLPRSRVSRPGGYQPAVGGLGPERGRTAPPRHDPGASCYPLRRDREGAPESPSGARLRTRRMEAPAGAS